MSRAILEHRRKMRKKMTNLQKENSKEYWNILRTKRNRTRPEIQMDTLYNYFKDLNNADDDEGDLII